MKGRIEEVLPGVAKPARYSGGELNAIRKPPQEVSVRTALAFPDIYEIGMSNLGLRILYYVLNREPMVAAERVFAPASDMEAEMRRSALPLFSLESALPVRDFDIVGFSLAYELSYTTVLNMLDLAGIPVLSGDRAELDPIVIAGGHCATNPEPMSDFIDAFAIGDGEGVVLDIVRTYQADRGNRANVLEALAGIDGVYVPSIHGRLTPRPSVRARIVYDLENAPFPDSLVVPFTETVHDRAALEIARGCSRGCRFCQAGMITRPVRLRSVARLSEQANALLDNTGYEEIALTSLSSADYPDIGELVRHLIERHSDHRVGVSLPSLRADADCVRLAAEISRVRKSGLTFAPEAGTQRLRDVINKNVTEDDLLQAVEAAADAGWQRVKLYFMIGLPTETDDDIRGIADLVHRVLAVGRARGRRLSVNVTISPFVPKPHTPFQWRAMVSPDELARRIALLAPMLRSKSVQWNWHDPKSSRVEAALGRGDARLGAVIHEAWKRGAKLEQDSFDYDRWLAAFESAGLDIAEFANAGLHRDADLPWNHVDVGVSREYLAAEDAKADRAEPTPDCRLGACAGCGVSRFLGAACPSPPLPLRESAAAMVASRIPDPGSETLSHKPSGIPHSALRILFVFRKTPEARWLGHLDLVRVFERAVRMSRLAVAYTQGFNPHPKISTASALPLGATAEAELLTIEFAGWIDPKDALRRLQAHLPPGIRLTEARVLTGKPPVPTASEFLVELSLPGGVSSGDIDGAIQSVLSAPELHLERRGRTMDLRPGIEELSLLEASDGDTATIRMRLPHRHFTVKPSEVASLIAKKLPRVRPLSIHRTRLITQHLTR